MLLGFLIRSDLCSNIALWEENPSFMHEVQDQHYSPIGTKCLKLQHSGGRRWGRNTDLHIGTFSTEEPRPGPPLQTGENPQGPGSQGPRVLVEVPSQRGRYVFKCLGQKVVSRSPCSNLIITHLKHNSSCCSESFKTYIQIFIKFWVYLNLFKNKSPDSALMTNNISC